MALAHQAREDDESGVLGCVYDAELGAGSYSSDRYTCCRRDDLWSGGVRGVGEICLDELGCDRDYDSAAAYSWGSSCYV